MEQLDIEQVLRERFGHEALLPGQQQVIDHLLAGRSAAAVFPTGGGKSLCYQLPALLLANEGLSLVVSPLIALMKDQIDALAARGIDAARLDSTLEADEAREIMQRARAGRLPLLYVAPERFTNERFRGAMRQLPVALFAVDEAHCISEWGHNFRPDYLKLARFACAFGARRALALTATATPRVLEDICAGFEIEPRCAIRTRFYRPNLTLLASPTSARARDAALLGRLRAPERPTGPAIVYVTLQRTAERVAGWLAAEGLDARAYHAGLAAEERASCQEWFLGSGQGIVVATIAFGMGIDKPDIRYVYHYNLPKSLENLAQEIGRAGRDGKPSICELLVCPDDLTVLENFVYGDTPAAAAVQGLIERLFDTGDDPEPELQLALVTLAREHDIRPLVVRTLLTYLELDGLLEETTPIFAAYRFKPLVPSREILGHFTGERRQFLADLLRQGQGKTVWVYIDIFDAAETLGAPRERIVQALEYLAQQGWIDLHTSGVRHRYRVRQRPPDLAALAASLYQRTLDRERRDIGRLEQVLTLTTAPDCLVSALGSHFGEPLDQGCGHCSSCLEERPQPALSTTRSDSPSHAGKGAAASEVLAAGSQLDRLTPTIDEAAWQRSLALVAEHAAALAEPRALARFLCGLTSPALTAAKLTRHDLFGCCGKIPFAIVLRRLSDSSPGSTTS